MIVFRNRASKSRPGSARIIIPVALSFAIFATAASVLAQTNQAPTPLIPQEGTPLAPSPATTETAPRPWTDDNVQIRPLAAVDFSAAGLIDAQNGGYPVTVWSGSEREALVSLISRLSPAMSPSAQAMAKRLLISTAEPPIGPQTTNPSLLSARAAKLINLGFTAEGLALAQINREAPDANLTRTLIYSSFLFGKYQDGCQRVAQALTQDATIEWLKANTFCRAKEGDSVGAEISAGLLRDQQVDDPGFFSLLNALNDSHAKIEGVDGKSTLHVAMLRAANRPLPAEVLSGASPGSLRALAEAPGPAALTLLAAEKACTYGAIMPEDLRNAYTLIRFEATDLANAKTGAPGYRDSRGNALFYQAGLVQPTAAQRAEMLSLALKNAVAQGLPPLLVGQTLSDQVRNIPPAVDLAWFAPDAVRMLLAAGDIASAKTWQALLLQQSAAGKVEPMQNPAITAALLQIADREAAHDVNEWLVQWYGAASAGVAPETRDRRATLLLIFLEALGYDAPSDIWQKLYTSTAGSFPGNEAPAPILYGLRAAARDKKLGETILFSLLALGQDGPGKADTATLAAVIAALRGVGLESDARQIALEAALARGL